MNNSFDVEQHSGCCAKVNKRCMQVCSADESECTYRSACPHEEKHYKYLCMCVSLSHAVVMLLDAVDVF